MEYQVSISSIVFDDVRNTLTFTMTRPTPPPPEGVRPDLWYPNQGGRFTFSIPINRSTFEEYGAIWVDPETDDAHRVTYSNGQWQMPGTLIRSGNRGT